jgi:hypothetical protein
MAIGMLSIVYARTQALHARRQADAAHLATTLEVQQAMAKRMYQTRLNLTSNPGIMAMYLEANPEMRELYPDVASVESTVVVRNIIDALQDMYFLRKMAIVDDHFWRNWMASFVPVARMPITRAVFDNAVERAAIEPEFASFLQPIFESRPLVDPKLANAER